VQVTIKNLEMFIEVVPRVVKTVKKVITVSHFEKNKLVTSSDSKMTISSMLFIMALVNILNLLPMKKNLNA
jgi:hypothetical protein